MEKHVALPSTRREIGWPGTGFWPFDLFAGLLMNRRFLLSIARRDMLAKYRGAFLGVLWLVGTPAALAAAYGFMTIGVFNMRAGSTGSLSDTLFTLWFSVNLWQALSESASRSASIVHDNAALVKRTPFPLTVLPPSTVLTSLMGLSISFGLGLVARIICFGLPPLAWIQLFALLVPFLLSTLAISYAVAALGAFVRDIRYVLPLALTAGMLVTPVLYPSSRVPASVKFVADLNPFTPVFDSARLAVTGSWDLPWTSLGIVTAISFAAAVLAYGLFRKTSPEFADVL